MEKIVRLRGGFPVTKTNAVFNEDDVRLDHLLDSMDKRIAEAVETAATPVEYMERTTWGDLKAMRDNGTLVPGRQYRITDYRCTTSQEGTMAENHRFDIIVTADSTTTLSENARACRHGGDDYFTEGCRLEAWRLMYCLDNDARRFAWACSEIPETKSEDLEFSSYTDGEHVSEYKSGNLVLKCTGGTSLHSLSSTAAKTFSYGEGRENRSFTRRHVTGGLSNTSSYLLLSGFPAAGRLFIAARNESITTATRIGIYQDNKAMATDIEVPRDSDAVDGAIPCVMVELKGTSPVRITYSRTLHIYDLFFEYKTPADNRGRGVIYHMTDEWGNETPYDARNIMLRRRMKMQDGYPVHDVNGGTDIWLYTFSAYDANRRSWYDAYKVAARPDGDGTGTNSLYGNIIRPYCYNRNDGNPVGSLRINNIVFYNHCNEGRGLTVQCHSNVFGEMCHDFTFGDGSCRNAFGPMCHSNVFGNGCTGNLFGSSCHDNTFGKWCVLNTVGGSFYGNTIGNNFKMNGIGISCHDCTFGDDVRFNTIRNNCNSNNIGLDCYGNTLGDNCTQVTIGNRSYHNVLGNGCVKCRLGVSNAGNILQPKCSNVILGNTNTYVTIGACCSDVQFGTYCTGVTLGNYCRIINYPAEVNYCRNVIFENGVSGVILTSTEQSSPSRRFQNIYVRSSLPVGNSIGMKTELQVTLENAFTTTFASTDDITITV